MDFFFIEFDLFLSKTKIRDIYFPVKQSRSLSKITFVSILFQAVYSHYSFLQLSPYLMGNSFCRFSPFPLKMGNISISFCKETGFSYQMKAIIYVIFIKVARKVEKVIYLWMKRKNALTVCVCVYERERVRVCERERE